MATLASFRAPGGVVGDSYFDANGEWQIVEVYDDGIASGTGYGDYNWGLVDANASVVTPPDTTGTLSARLLSTRHCDEDC